MTLNVLNVIKIFSNLKENFLNTPVLRYKGDTILTVGGRMIEGVAVSIVDILPLAPEVIEQFVFASARVVVVGAQFDQ